MLVYDVFYYQDGLSTREMDRDISYNSIQRARRALKPGEGLRAICANGDHSNDLCYVRERGSRRAAEFDISAFLSWVR